MRISAQSANNYSIDDIIAAFYTTKISDSNNHKYTRLPWSIVPHKELNQIPSLKRFTRNMDEFYGTRNMDEFYGTWLYEAIDEFSLQGIPRALPHKAFKLK